MTKKPFRVRYADALLSENALRPTERLVALVYVRYAGAKDAKTQKRADEDVAWCAWTQLAKQTGIRSRDTLSKATRALEEAGWMTQIEPARQHSTPRYQLTIPTNPNTRLSVAVDLTERAAR